MTKYLALSTLLLCFFASNTFAQVSLTAAPLTIDFTGFDGSGFATAPTAGQLDADDWATNGLSDGNMDFGDPTALGTSGDHTGTLMSPGTSGGGFYSLDDGGNQMLWIQPTGGDFTPGSLTLKAQNNSGALLTDLNVAYILKVYNDQPRGNSFNFTYSSDNVTYLPVPILDYTSPELADAVPAILSLNQATTISGLSVAPGDFVYLRWESNDVVGGGSRDEFGLDDIVLEIATGGGLPTYNFTASSLNVQEAAGSASVDVLLSIPSDCTIEVALDAASTATNGVDFNFTSPQTLTYTSGGGNSQTVNVSILDDAMIEGNETIVLNLQTVGGTGGCQIGGNSQVTITITDDDYPAYTISQLNTEDAMGVADSLGVLASVTGIVYGIDYNSGGSLEFFLRDATGGIGVFAGTTVDSYVVTEGDEITMVGTVGQFRGLTQLAPASIVVNSTGNTLVTPTVVSTPLDETTEAELIRINDLTLVDPAQWTTGMGGFGFNVDATDGTNTYLIYIDADCSLYNAPAPTGMFDIKGLGSQRSSGTSAPFTDGYRIVPRYDEDLMEALTPNVSFVGSSVTVDEAAGMVGITLGVNVTPLDNISCDVSVTGGTATDGSDFTTSVGTYNFTPAAFADQSIDLVTIIDDMDLEGPEDIILSISLTSGTATASNSLYTITITDNDVLITPELNFSSNGVTVNEDAGTVSVEVTIADENANATNVDVSVGATSSATDGVDFAAFTPTTLNFPATSSASQTVSIDIIDDTTPEGSETIVLLLTNPDNMASIGDNSTYVITIAESDGGVGIYDAEISRNVLIYPNPVIEMLNIEADVKLESIRISNGIGQEFKQILQPDNKLQINTADLTRGIYFIHFISENGAWSTSFVKE